MSLTGSSSCGGDVVLDYTQTKQALQPYCLAGTSSVSFSPGYTAGQSAYTTYNTNIAEDGGVGANPAYQSDFGTSYAWDPGATYKDLSSTTGGTLALPAFTSLQFAPQPATVGLDALPIAPVDLVGVLITPYSTQGASAFNSGPVTTPIGFSIAFDYMKIGPDGISEISSCAGKAATFTVNRATFTAADPCKSGDVAFDFVNGALHDVLVGGLIGADGGRSTNSQLGLPTGWKCSGSGCPPGGATSAPEIDAESATGALLLLLSVTATLRGPRLLRRLPA